MPCRGTMLAGALLLGYTAPAQARISAVVVRWGEMEVQGAGEPAPAAEAGSYIGRTVYNRHGRQLNWSTQLPAMLCRGFGTEIWAVAGSGEALPDRLTLHMRHPLLTRPDGVSETEFTAPLFLTNGKAGYVFTFDEPWEAQPGDWTMDFLLAGEVLASKTFTVAPLSSGEPSSACQDVPQS